MLLAKTDLPSPALLIQHRTPRRRQWWIEYQMPGSSPTNADSLTWRVTFSEAVDGVGATDFQRSGATAGLSVAAFCQKQ